MHQARGVGRLERPGRLDGDAHRFAPIERALSEPCVECLAGAELHREERASVEGLSEVVELHDVRVREVGDGAGFVPEALEGAGRRGVLRAEDLHGELATELHVLRFEDGAAGPFAELATKAVRGPRELGGVGGDHPRGDRFAHGAGGRRDRAVVAQRFASFVQEPRELGARPGGLVRPELAHHRDDARANAAFVPFDGGSRRDELHEVRRGEARALESLVRVVLRQLRDDRVELGRGAARRSDAGHPHVARRGLVEVPLGVAGEEASPRAELPEHDAQGEEIDAPVADLLACHFGGHVAGLGEDHAGDGAALPVETPRGAEVDELDLSRVAHHHVLRGEVAVHDAERRAVDPGSVVHVRERLRHFDGNGERVRPRDPHAHLDGALSQIAERPSLDVLHGRVRLALLVGVRLEDLSHPRVLKLRLDARFVEEPRQERPVVHVIASDRLDDAGPLGALDPRRRGEIHVAHPAARRELEEHAPAVHPRKGQRDGRRKASAGFAHWPPR